MSRIEELLKEKCPDGVEFRRLEDCCNILDKKRKPVTKSAREAGEYPYYGANGVQDYVADYIFDDELVLVAEDGGHFGSADKPIAYRVSGKCWVNNHAHVLKPKECIDVDYLCYSLMFRDVSDIVNGATRQKLTQADMRKIEIPLLPMKNQKAVVDKLGKVFELIALRKEQLAKLDQLVKYRFIELFGDVKEEDKLINLCNFIDYRGKTPEKAEDGLPFITAKNVKMHHMSFDTQEFISKETYDRVMTRGFPRIGDVVFTTEAPLGNVCRIPHIETEFYIGQRIITMQTEQLEPAYLEYALSSDDFKRKITEKSSGSTVTGIRSKLLEQLTIPVPPKVVQKQFAAFVEQTDKSKLVIQQSLDKLETLKKSLMQEYFG